MIYKITDKDLYSCLSSGDYGLRYGFDFFAKEVDNSLGLFCFNNLKDTFDFIRGNVAMLSCNGYRIFEVETMGSKPTPQTICFACHGNYLEMYYLLGMDKRTSHHSKFICSGTVCFREVKLSKEIDINSCK